MGRCVPHAPREQRRRTILKEHGRQIFAFDDSSNAKRAFSKRTVAFCVLKSDLDMFQKQFSQTDFREPVSGNRFPEIGFRKPFSRNRFSEAGFRKPVLENRFTGSRLSDKGFWNPVFGNRFPGFQKPFFVKPVSGDPFGILRFEFRLN